MNSRSSLVDIKAKEEAAIENILRNFDEKIDRLEEELHYARKNKKDFLAGLKRK